MVEQRTLTPSVVVRIHVPQLISAAQYMSGFFYGIISGAQAGTLIKWVAL